MPRRSSRFDTLPPDVYRASVVRSILASVRPFSPAYRAGLAVIDAIDGLAEVITGDREHFHDRGSRHQPLDGA